MLSQEVMFVIFAVLVISEVLMGVLLTAIFRKHEKKTGQKPVLPAAVIVAISMLFTFTAAGILIWKFGS
ncbi:MAG: hypothetical protein ACWA5R_06605 [bacterium]